MNTPPPTGPLDRALDALRAMPVPVPGRPPDADVLARLASAAPGTADPLSPKRRNWMRIATRSSLAAGVLIAAATVYLLTGPSSVALADVVKAAQKHKLVRYKMEQTTEDRDNGTGTAESVHHADLKAPRFRIDSKSFLTLNGNVESAHYSVQDDRRDRWLGVLTETLVKDADKDAPEVKTFLAEYGATRKHATLMRSPTKDSKKNTKTFLDYLHGLEKHKDIAVARDKVGGKAAVRYSLEEEDGKKVTKLWVDAKTKLPVRLEVEWTDPTERISSNKFVFTDFEWDPKLPRGFKTLDDLFDTAPPKGYKLFDNIKDKEKTRKSDDE